MKIVRILTALLLTSTALGQGPVSVGPWNDASKSYQERATWWNQATPFPEVSITFVVQRYALACLFFATWQKPNQYVTPTQGWKTFTNWMSEKNVCTWYGIKCNQKGFITEINLSGNRLTGVFPLEMATIGYGLLRLDISNNDIASFNGDLVWMSYMKVMAHLDIHSTNLDYVGIPPWLADMTALQYLDMSYTYFYGELDGTVFSKLKNLTHLDIAGNDYLGGTVPTQIAGLPKLQLLHIDYTEFGGDLNWMSLLNTGIKEVWADSNPWQAATIPTTIGKLISLQSLSLYECQLGGTIPTQVGNLKAMKKLWLYNNTLQGTIPSQIGNLVNMTTFQTENNLLAGEMPSQICSLSSTKLKQLSTDCKGSSPEVKCTCCQCCASPCFPPAPAFCFSGDSVVEVVDRGLIKMEHLELNDEVRAGKGTFSRVYSFGHYNKDTNGEYLQLFCDGLDSPLEISKDHMLFVDERGAVPAAQVSVGDSLLLGTGRSTKVVKIGFIESAGAFAPFTESGTIVVNGVVASSYVSLQDESESFSIAGIKVASMHWLAHAFQAPHRMMCKVSAGFCASETYSDEGISNWVYGPYLFFTWLLSLPFPLSALLSVPVFLSGVVLYAMEMWFMNIWLVLATAAVAVCIAGSKEKVL